MFVCSVKWIWIKIAYWAISDVLESEGENSWGKKRRKRRQAWISSSINLFSGLLALTRMPVPLWSRWRAALNTSKMLFLIDFDVHWHCGGKESPHASVLAGRWKCQVKTRCLPSRVFNFKLLALWDASFRCLSAGAFCWKRLAPEALEPACCLCWQHTCSLHTPASVLWCCSSAILQLLWLKLSFCCLAEIRFFKTGGIGTSDFLYLFVLNI